MRTTDKQIVTIKAYSFLLSYYVGGTYDKKS